MLLIDNLYFSKLNGGYKIIFCDIKPDFNLGKDFCISDFKIVHLDRKITFLQNFVEVVLAISQRETYFVFLRF
jgi:hypothetical protein